ncbi:hypothetical protein SUGI_0350380 [Cryptomeria japonica]|nr:hypothetical protein SUGI_0350380 [Cryptomeria japonica]
MTTLILKECPLTCLPPLPKTLTYLELAKCDKLDACDRVVELKALQYLNLKGCTSLKKLPSTFGELRALQGLNLEGCSSLEEIAGFKRLIGLKYLNARNCPKLSLSSATSPASDLRIKNKEEMKIEEKQQTMVD